MYISRLLVSGFKTQTSITIERYTMKKQKNALSFDQIIDRICTAVNIVTGDDGHRAKQTLETFLQLVRMTEEEYKKQTKYYG